MTYFKILKYLFYGFINKPITVKLPENKQSFVDLYNRAAIECAPGSFGYKFEKMARRN